MHEYLRIHYRDGKKKYIHLSYLRSFAGLQSMPINNKTPTFVKRCHHFHAPWLIQVNSCNCKDLSRSRRFPFSSSHEGKRRPVCRTCLWCWMERR